MKFVVCLYVNKHMNNKKILWGKLIFHKCLKVNMIILNKISWFIFQILLRYFLRWVFADTDVMCFKLQPITLHGKPHCFLCSINCIRSSFSKPHMKHITGPKCCLDTCCRHFWPPLNILRQCLQRYPSNLSQAIPLVSSITSKRVWVYRALSLDKVRRRW